jgi:hypothetical protein
MGLDLTDIKKQKKNQVNERFERISATNDAISEVDLLTDQSWNNKAFIELLISVIMVSQVPLMIK